MKKLVCLVLSLVFVCTSITALADSNKFITEYIAGGVYETLYSSYSDFSGDKNVLGFYKANSNCDSEKASYIAFYKNGNVFATVSGTSQVLNFKGTYTEKDGTISVKLENNNEYVRVDYLIEEPFKYEVTSKNTIKYNGRDFTVSPKNGETYTLISGDGFGDAPAKPAVTPGNTTAAGSTTTDAEISVKYNGEKVEFDQAPVIINGRTMVPIRAVMEKMGCTVTWKDETKTANIKNDYAACALQVGNELMSVLDKTTSKQSVQTLDSAPVIINSRLLLPLRAVAEVFNAKVDWNEKTRTVLVNYNGYEEEPEEVPEEPEDVTENEDVSNNEGTETTPDGEENTETEEVYEPDTVYLKQRSNDTCTLAATAMMLRKSADLADRDFVKITELRLKPYAWQDEGLKSSFLFETYEVKTYESENPFDSLLYEDKKDALISLLSEHPEGIVAYDSNAPHAIWISSYDEATGYFYVSDPSPAAPEGIVILEESSITGTTAAEKITAIDKIWYVSSN